MTFLTLSSILQVLKDVMLQFGSFMQKSQLQIATFSVLSFLTVLGDDIMALPVIAKSMSLRALVDNGLHSAIAGLSWSLVTQFEGQPFIRIAAETVGCAALGSLIDIDHFAAAWSFNLRSATLGLSGRPPFHSTTPFVALWLSLLIIHWFTTHWVPHRIAWAIFLAVGSHHLRDAIRHGFWFPPWGSTTPVPFWIYVFGTVLFPLVVYAAMKITLCEKRPFLELPQDEKRDI